MSIYDFYPMKKRRLCKTPNEGRSGSTLGKLKKTTENLASTTDSRIEVLWDNNSPSPTTTLALGKRRRKRQTNRSNEDDATDISFVVQKLSENTSPVVDNTHSTLLEMWVNKGKHCNDGEEDFTSPPNEVRQEKRKAALSTPLNQRRTSKRTTRKGARQIMLEIRKLVDDIQKNDLNSCGNETQRSSQVVEEQTQSQRNLRDDVVYSSITTTKPRILPNQQTCTKLVSESHTTGTDGLLEDSFEWTEDDMDELILTCQLSSSGKGTLDAPDPPRPHFGFSPSSVTLVPETQMLSRDQDASKEPCGDHEVPKETRGDHEEPVEPLEKAAVKLEDNRWEISFADDSLLETAAQEFELSQESASMKSREVVKRTDNTRCTSTEARNVSNPISNSILPIQTNPVHFTNIRDKHSRDKHSTMSMSVAQNQARRQEKCAPIKKSGENIHGKHIDFQKSDENRYSPKGAQMSRRAKHGSMSPLKSRPGNPINPIKKPGTISTKTQSLSTSRTSSTKQLTVNHCSYGATVRKDCRTASFVGTKRVVDDVECLFPDDNFAALLDDVNFEESFNKALPEATSISVNEICATSSNDVIPSSLITKKATYTKDEIEQKRLEAQRRRLSKLQATAKTGKRNTKMR